MPFLSGARLTTSRSHSYGLRIFSLENFTVGPGQGFLTAGFLDLNLSPNMSNRLGSQQDFSLQGDPHKPTLRGFDSAKEPELPRNSSLSAFTTMGGNIYLPREVYSTCQCHRRPDQKESSGMDTGDQRNCYSQDDLPANS